jgi:hypothetical protein
MTSSREREAVWERAEADGDGKVFCNLCGGEILPTELWEISHVGAPAALGGIDTGVAHKLCNRQHGLAYVIPMVAKTKRMRRKHRGIAGPGFTDTPLPAGRQSNITKKLNGEVESRLPRYGKHARAMAALWPHGRPE